MVIKHVVTGAKLVRGEHALHLRERTTGNDKASMAWRRSMGTVSSRLREGDRVFLDGERLLLKAPWVDRSYRSCRSTIIAP